jgi:hypothetical protein
MKTAEEHYSDYACWGWELVRSAFAGFIEDAGRNLMVVDDVEREQAPSLPLGFSRQDYPEVSLHHGIHVVAF